MRRHEGELQTAQLLFRRPRQQDCLLHRKSNASILTLECFQCAEGAIPEDVMQNLINGPNGKLTCKPRFLIYCEGQLKQEITGPDYSVLVAACNKYIPQIDD